MEVGELVSFLNNKKEKVKIEERFDLKCYTTIGKAIDNRNDTILLKIEFVYIINKLIFY